MGLEQESWWDDLVAKKDTHSLRELAEEFGVSAGAISLALKKTNTSKVPQGGEPSDNASADTPTSRPGSKDHLIEPLLEQLGSIPDAEVARKAGVSVRTVASYRSRNKIPGYKGRGTPGKKRRRKSKIDPYTDLLGKVPDRVIAEKAGVTLNAVRNYRANRGIISSRQRNKEMRESGLTEADMQAMEAQDTPTATSTVTTFESTHTPSTNDLPPPPVSGGLFAWNVAFEGGREGVVTAHDASDAASKGSSFGVVIGVSRLGQLIG